MVHYFTKSWTFISKDIPQPHTVLTVEEEQNVLCSPVCRWRCRSEAELETRRRGASGPGSRQPHTAVTRCKRGLACAMLCGVRDASQKPDWTR